MVKAGLKAIYLSGWQVAADANSAAETYPDQSLYPVDSVPRVVKRINNVSTLAPVLFFVCFFLGMVASTAFFFAALFDTAAAPRTEPLARARLPPPPRLCRPCAALTRLSTPRAR